ncbi:DMT family transporter [Brachyspira innocens]|uniref:DMT family transporter n=1 Tax=Brachyspira innocens TaxID=13264 RepID=UPI0026EEA24B|nr:DMT family transporter [Brachyspira innocens]MDO6994778.1 DMT family transporter [Brachyspira innocens]
MSENKISNNNNSGYILAILAVIIWSGNFVAARFLVDFTPIEISFYRWLITFIVLTPFCIKKLIKNIKYLKGRWIKVIIISILGVTVFNTFVYLAAHTSNATNMSLLATLSPIVMAIISRIVWKTKLTIHQKLGLLIVIVGVVILITKGSIEVLMSLKFAIGDLYMLFAVILFAVYTLTIKIRPKEISQSAFFYLMVIIGLIPLLAAMIFTYASNNAHALDTKSALILIYVGVFPSALGFILWNMAIAKIGAIKGGIIYDSIPFFSSLEAVILLHENLLISQVVGGLLILAGIIYSTVGDKIKNK